MKCLSMALAPPRNSCEFFAADDQFRDQSDRRPHRIAAAHPIPHREAMLGRDAECVHGLGVGRHRDEMMRGRLLAQRSDDPGARRVRVGLRLLGGEGLRADDHQGLRRIDAADQILELRAIDVRHEMRRDVAAPFGLERIAHQQWSQVGAADADVHHMLEFLARYAALIAAAHRGDVARELVARVFDLRLDRRRARELRAQRGMQHRAPLGGVDGIAAKHRGDALRQLHRPRQLEQQRQGLLRDALAREIEQPGVVLDVEILPALGIRGEQIAQVRAADVSSMSFDRAPCGKRGIQCAIFLEKAREI